VRRTSSLDKRIYKSIEIRETATAVRTYFTKDIDPITKEKSLTKLTSVGRPEVKQTDLSQITFFGKDRVDYMKKCAKTNKGKPFWTPEERNIFGIPFRSKIKSGVKISMASVDRFIISLKVTYPTFIDSLSDPVIRRSVYYCVNNLSKKKVTCFGPFPETLDTGPLAVKEFVINKTSKRRYPVAD
jgi:hypothetical protein